MQFFPRFTARIVLFSLISSFIFSACSNSQNELDKLNWLTGRWENGTEGMRTIEIWKRKNAEVFQVKGLMLEGKDTIFSESITVSPRQGNIYYAVTIPDENNGLPVAFKLTENTGNKVVFENLKHDFPQKITYQNSGSDSILVQIEGVVKNKLKKEAYYLKKSPN